MAEVVTISKSDLTQKVNDGWKKPQLAEYYGLPVTQITQALQQAQLKIRKFHKPKFVLVEETAVAVEVTDVNEEADYNAALAEQAQIEDEAPLIFEEETPVLQSSESTSTGSW